MYILSCSERFSVVIILYNCIVSYISLFFSDYDYCAWISSSIIEYSSVGSPPVVTGMAQVVEGCCTEVDAFPWGVMSG